MYFKENIVKMETNFAGTYGTFEDALAQAPAFSQCGKCGNFMKIVADFHKIHCSDCKLT